MDADSLIFVFNVAVSRGYLQVTSPQIPGLEVQMGRCPLAEMPKILETAMQAAMGPLYPNPAAYMPVFDVGTGRLSPHSVMCCIFRPTGAA